jgi:hypothetical protein
MMSCETDSNTSDLIALPTTFPVILDVGKNLETILLKFYLSGEGSEREICSGTLVIPADVSYNVEINTSSRIYKRIYGVHALDDMLGVDFKLTFVNTILFEGQGEPLP